MREPLDDGRLADAGLADEHGIVLGAAAEDLHHALDLVRAADAWVELALLRQLREVAAELLEHLGGALALDAGGRRLLLASAAWTAERVHDLVADLLGFGVQIEKDACRNALVLAHETEEYVLGPDVVVAQRQSLAQRQLEHLLRSRRERDLTLRLLLARAHDTHDGRPDFLDGDVQPLEHAGSDALLLAQKAEQKVFRTDVVVLERPCLFLSEDDDLPGTFGESFEHPATPSRRTGAA